MAYDDIPIKSADVPPRLTKTVQAQTRIRCGAVDASIVKGSPTVHSIRLHHRVRQQTLWVTLASSMTDDDVVYDHPDPRHWLQPEFPVDPERSGLTLRPNWAERQIRVEHPGTCQPGNGHTAAVQVRLRTANPAEACPVGGELSYQFTCK